MRWTLLGQKKNTSQSNFCRAVFDRKNYAYNFAPRLALLRLKPSLSSIAHSVQDISDDPPVILVVVTLDLLVHFHLVVTKTNMSLAPAGWRARICPVAAAAHVHKGSSKTLEYPFDLNPDAICLLTSSLNPSQLPVLPTT